MTSMSPVPDSIIHEVPLTASILAFSQLYRNVPNRQLPCDRRELRTTYSITANNGLGVVNTHIVDMCHASLIPRCPY